jgi:hypothetical protein
MKLHAFVDLSHNLRRIYAKSAIFATAASQDHDLVDQWRDVVPISVFCPVGCHRCRDLFDGQ